MNALTTAKPLTPNTLAEAMDFAKMLGRSKLVPKDFIGRPEDIVIAVLWGKEIGISPVQAMQSIAVINGRPAIWGDAAMALARSHPACEAITEGVEGEGEQMIGWCEVKRRRMPAQRRTFSVADARKAGLWGKPGPWQSYPKRMLQLRARGFALRDVLPDALKGIMVREELDDSTIIDATAEAPVLAEHAIEDVPAGAKTQTEAIAEARADMVAAGQAFEVKFPNGATKVYGERGGAWDAIVKAAMRCESLSELDTLEADNEALLDYRGGDGVVPLALVEAREGLGIRREELSPKAEWTTQ